MTTMCLTSKSSSCMMYVCGRSMVAPGHNALDIPLTTMCWTSASDSCIMYIDDEGRAFITTHTDRENIMNFPSLSLDAPATPANEVSLPAVLESNGWEMQPVDSPLMGGIAEGLAPVKFALALPGNLMLMAQEQLNEHSPTLVTDYRGRKVDYSERRLQVSIWVPLKKDFTPVQPDEAADLIEGYTRIGYALIDRVANLVYINTMIVENRWMGQGFGKTLLNTCEIIAKCAGATRVILHPTPHPIRPGPKSLTAWYKKQGYKSFVPSYKVARLVKTASEFFAPGSAPRGRTTQALKWTRGLLSKKVGAGAQDRMALPAFVANAGAFCATDSWDDANEDSEVMRRLGVTGFKPSEALRETATQVKDAACYAR